MDTSESQSASPVEELLQERSRYQQWLGRLYEAGNRAPDAVKKKIEADYRQRLEGVLDQLRSHASSLAEELERHRGEQATLDERRSAASEELAEAEVRHMVGEYGDEEWQRISSEHQEVLGRVGDELTQVQAEIARLEEVQRLIESPEATQREEAPKPAKEKPAPAAPAPEPARFEPPSASSTPPAGDELAFLKSVTADAAPQRAAPATTAAAGNDTAKTLKCGECGTMNRPTEWYCERCGAELAAL